jgi:hypothetical protein
MTALPPMAGIIASSEGVVDREVDFFKSVDPDFGDRTCRTFSETSGIGMFPPDSSIVGSPYYINGRRMFSKLALGKNLRVMRSIWGDAFFRHTNALVRSGGSIFVPYTPDDEKARTQGLYTLDELLGLFRQEGRILADANVVVFEAIDEVRATPSTLSWYVENCGAVVHEEIALRQVPHLSKVARRDDIYLEMMLKDAERLVQSPRTSLLDSLPSNWFSAGLKVQGVDAVSYGEKFAAALKSVSYLFSGNKYKMPIIKHIVQQHASVAPGGSAIDFGGGYGTLIAELLLDPDLKLARGVVNDYSTIYESQAGNLYRAFRSEFHHRFFFSSARMEDFEFDRQYNIITALSSLLYAPKDRWRSIISNWWENLAVGGVMVCFELPKADPRNPHYKVQFTAEELEEELGTYGEVHRYGATSLRPLTVEQAGTSATFRAVVKR